MLSHDLWRKLRRNWMFPIIAFHVNCYFPPMPTARTCYELGRSIEHALKGRPERVAIMASGGLSHDPRGPRAGWIDTALDRWVSNNWDRETVKRCVISSSSIRTRCEAEREKSEVGSLLRELAAMAAPPLSIISRLITR